MAFYHIPAIKFVIRVVVDVLLAVLYVLTVICSKTCAHA